MKKNIMTVLLTAALCTAVYAGEDIDIEIDNYPIDFSEYDDVLPYIENSRVMIPVRAVAENMGADVDWDAKAGTVTIGGDIVLTIDSDEAIVNGDTVELDAPAEIRQSRTFVPLRFVAENMGANVEWDNDERKVSIYTGAQPHPEEEEPVQSVTDERNGEYSNVVYLGVADYGKKSSDLKDYFMHRFFCDGKVVEYPVKKDDNYTLQNKLAEGYVYNIKIENSIIVDVYESAATSGVISSVSDDSIKLENNKRNFLRPVVYKIRTSAGNVSVTETTPETGNSIDVYSADTAYSVQPSKTLDPVVKGTPGEKTLKNFIATAMMPMGHTLYVYGGGWNWQDNGSSVQATTIGVPQKWVDFFDKNDEDYTYRTEDPASTYYPHMAFNQYYYAGADCSGYVGWTIYNTLNTQSGGSGYVMASTAMAKTLAQQYNYGTWTQDIHKEAFVPGDIMSINGHVWIYLGACGDGSAVIMHSTPSSSVAGQPGGGVQLAALGDKDSQAYALADKYMKKFYPEWSERYRTEAKSYNAYTGFEGDTAGRFTWNRDTLADPDGYAQKSADDILKDLFGE